MDSRNGTDPMRRSRRDWLRASLGLGAGLSAGLGAGLLTPAGMALAHNDAGAVSPPLAVPDLRVTWHTGARGSLREALAGRVTALQTMFTGCSATCPIQGALFGALQPLAPPRVQLISLSIDPLSDDPKALSRWLGRFEAKSAWRAGAPDHRQVDPLLNFLRARTNTSDRHTAQVYLFDPQGRLVLRTTDFPAPEAVARMLGELVRAQG